jgi:hypothetical protein
MPSPLKIKTFTTTFFSQIKIKPYPFQKKILATLSAVHGHHPTNTLEIQIPLLSVASSSDPTLFIENAGSRISYTINSPSCNT